MYMEKERAVRIVSKMARERYKTVGDVLLEFVKYNKEGECQHFWPDENTACQLLLVDRTSK